jgi:DNA-binding transcriptional ArsR family regulator
MTWSPASAGPGLRARWHGAVQPGTKVRAISYLSGARPSGMIQVVPERGCRVAGKDLVGPEVDALDLGAVFRALADEHRRSVMTQLAADRSDGERGCNSFDLPISKQTQTHHFRVLREAGLVDEIDYGNRKGIRLRRADIEKRFPGLLALLGTEPPGDTAPR